MAEGRKLRDIEHEARQVRWLNHGQKVRLLQDDAYRKGARLRAQHEAEQRWRDAQPRDKAEEFRMVDEARAALARITEAHTTRAFHGRPPTPDEHQARVALARKIQAYDEGGRWEVEVPDGQRPEAPA